MGLVSTAAPYAFFIACQAVAGRRLARAFPGLGARLRGSRLRWLAALLVGWLNVAPLLFFVSPEPLPADGLAARLLLGPSIAYGLSALGVALALGLPGAAAALVRSLRRTPPVRAADGGPPLSRRRFLQAGAGGAVLVAGSSSAWATWVGNDRLQVEQLALHHPALPAALDGLRLVHLSDLHVGAWMAPARLLGYVAQVEALRPDLVVVTGDLMDDELTQLPLAAAALGRLRAPLGVWATLGNHDHWRDAAAIRAALADHGVRVLSNGAATLAGLRPGGEGFAVVGIDDPESRADERYEPMLREAFARVPETARFRLLLTHRPDAFPLAAPHGATLTLAGHTHGGQAILPLPFERGLTVARLMTPYDHGLFRRGAAFLYVNRGLGVSNLPVRFNCPREITVITLRHAPAAVASVAAVTA